MTQLGATIGGALLAAIPAAGAWFALPEAWVAIATPVALAIWFASFVLVVTPYRLWREQKLQLDAAHETATRVKIKTLFALLGESGFGPDRKAIGNDILDALSRGDLTALGRPVRRGGTARQVEVSREYWREADWNYRFLLEDNYDGEQCFSRDIMHNFNPITDLEFRLSEVLRVWPDIDTSR